MISKAKVTPTTIANLNRVQEQGLGINGIEPWKDGEYYGVDVYEDHAKA